MRLRAAIEAGDEGRTQRLFKLAQQEKSAALPRMESRMVRADLDFRAARAGLTDADRVAMWWMETPYPGNLGDIINPYIIERLNGRPPRFVAKGERLLAVGSIIKFADAEATVYGAGASREATEVSPQARFCAVRGPLTRQIVLASGANCPEVYGDLAWLLPRLYAPAVAKRHRLGLILHHVHEDLPARIGRGVHQISIRRCGYAQIEKFIREMLSCEAIISTSLHGVIIAHAYGIPVRFATSSGSAGQIAGDGLKFQDYFLSVGRDCPEPLDLWPLQEITTELAASCVDNPARPIDVEALVAAAPFPTPGWTSR